MKILICLAILLMLGSFVFSNEPEILNSRSLIQSKNIRFIGEVKSKLEAVILIDEVLKAQGNLSGYGDLSVGLEVLEKDMIINIEEKEGFYNIELEPISGAGHDFSFSIDIEKKKLINVVIGSIEPPPDIE